ncbi:DUF4041 domain-containing protein [Enterovirga rhinocerotis]|uniref:T5orf172 domain-containing protein n=1 Tax=Enterovirga rhinocerotis TaxID=1339210 RepID=A0A4R7BZV8_9HYPH|nr:DUF4041 domain-containing protein [Enterovirga rhinocerotis]TDR90315.1 T5orf172 domain-containing protein [Enterovirga rhinocerotis]
MESLVIIAIAGAASLICACVALVLFLIHVRRKLAEERQLRAFEAALHSRELDEQRATSASDLDTQKSDLLKALAEVERRNVELEEKLEPIYSIEDELANLRSEIITRLKQIESLKSAYSEKKTTFDSLVAEVAIYDERLAFAELGVYEPHFEFEDSEAYKKEVSVARAHQKMMANEKTAVVSKAKIYVDGSLAKGQTLINRTIRLTLRAFNGEADAAVANVRWNNVNAMESRILAAKNKIDIMNESQQVVISREYAELKLRELYLTHEMREKQRAEREERAEQARLAREEQKLLRDLEAAEEEEARYQRLLDKAKAEANSIAGPHLAAFNEQIAILERDLAAAHSKLARAQAMAEKTRSGWVYVISNVGSFGDGVVKIGLTRRLDPLDRVRELGDASVPFIFDTHAMIYSDDAPTLERALHAEFDATRINAMNYRKEFFRASIDEVEAALKRLAPSATFHRDVEAQDYRETQARRSALLASIDASASTQFPDSL